MGISEDFVTVPEDRIRDSCNVEVYQRPFGPVLGPIKVLHRHNDGYIPFGVKSEPDGQWKSIASIRADVLDSMFPESRDELMKDSFVGINAAYGRGKSRRPYGFPNHRVKSLRYLCACYADLDFYKVNLTFNETQKRVADLCDAGVLPRPSIFADSGRGMWLLWLLQDQANPDQAHFGAWIDNPADHLILYGRINQAIGERLTNLGSDAGARDAARYLRVPGSFHTGAERSVRWQIHFEGDRVCGYTLAELASFFKLDRPRRIRQEREAVTIRPQGNRWKGHRQANANKLKAFICLRDLRGGGFDEGMRGNALYIYASVLRANKTPPSEALKQVIALASACRPPKSRADCVQTVDGVYRAKGSRNLKYLTIADRLRVSSSEAEIISQSIKKAFPFATGCGPIYSELKAEESNPSLRAERDVMQ